MLVARPSTACIHWAITRHINNHALAATATCWHHLVWNAPRTVDTNEPQNEACSKTSGLTPPRWL
jgi:hypothetical protein